MHFMVRKKCCFFHIRQALYFIIHDYQNLIRILYSCYFATTLLHNSQHTHVDFKVFHNILHSPDINHELFKVGLATSIAIMLLKGYVELYAGKTQKRKVEYDNFKSATHWTILLILISWISFHLSLSPVYGTFKTWLIMIGFGYGILLQSALLVSNYVNLLIFLVVFYI